MRVSRMGPQEHQVGVKSPSGFWWLPQSWSLLLASSLFPACLVAYLSFYVEWGIELGASSQPDKHSTI